MLVSGRVPIPPVTKTDHRSSWKKSRSTKNHFRKGECLYNPNDHCFDRKGPCFGGLGPLKNRGQSNYTLILCAIVSTTCFHHIISWIFIFHSIEKAIANNWVMQQTTIHKTNQPSTANQLSFFQGWFQTKFRAPCRAANHLHPMWSGNYCVTAQMWTFQKTTYLSRHFDMIHWMLKDQNLRSAAIVF